MGVKRGEDDVRLVCTHCPKVVVELGLIGHVHSAQFEVAKYEGRCEECLREYELDVSSMKEPT